MDIQLIRRNHARLTLTEIHCSVTIHPHLTDRYQVDDSDDQQYRQHTGKNEVPETGIVIFDSDFSPGLPHAFFQISRQDHAGNVLIASFVGGFFFQFTFNIVNIFTIRNKHDTFDRLIFQPLLKDALIQVMFLLRTA